MWFRRYSTRWEQSGKARETADGAAYRRRACVPSDTVIGTPTLLLRSHQALIRLTKYLPRRCVTHHSVVDLL